jgi:hypothetical protein
MFYYTHHIDRDAPECVHIDAPSDYLCPWMFYYTIHINMDAPQYVHADVHSHYFCLWKFYYTYNSDMDAPKCVHVDVTSDYPVSRTFYYITAIWTVPSMYEVLQFNSQFSCSVSLGCRFRQTCVFKHIWTCSNLHLHEPQTKWVIRSRAAEEIACVRCW